MSSIKTHRGYIPLAPKKMYTAPEAEYALRPWDEKYDRSRDPSVDQKAGEHHAKLLASPKV